MATDKQLERYLVRHLKLTKEELSDTTKLGQKLKEKQELIEKIEDTLFARDLQIFNSKVNINGTGKLLKTLKDLLKYQRAARETRQRQGMESKRPKIVYVVNAITVSGGMHVIQKHCNLLAERGYNVSILNLSSLRDSPKWFKLNCPVFELGTIPKYFLDDVDIMIATHWLTAQFVFLSTAKRKIYFVQSDERRFNFDRAYFDNIVAAVQRSYELSFEFMTEAIWIQRWLKEEFGHDAYYVPNGLDLDIFKKVKPIEPKGKRVRILLEGQIDFWLKAMDETYDAVKDLDAELWVVSGLGKPRSGWKVTKTFEKVALHEMNQLYSSCDIFVKLSRVEGFYGPPMEAMACGCAVVTGKVSGWDEYIVNEHNALVVEKGDIKGARNSIRRLMEDKSLREKLIENGYKTAKEWPWTNTIDRLEKVILHKPIDRLYTETFPEPYSFQQEKEALISFARSQFM